MSCLLSNVDYWYSNLYSEADRKIEELVRVSAPATLEPPTSTEGRVGEIMRRINECFSVCDCRHTLGVVERENARSKTML